jgi:toxin ParE1/3/4
VATSESESEEAAPLHTILIRPEAEADIAAAYQYYALVAEGLELEFERVLEASLAQIQRHPELFALVYQNVRRALLRRFPYGLLYIVEPQHIVVLGCFHVRRDPRSWPGRYVAPASLGLGAAPSGMGP